MEEHFLLVRPLFSKPVAGMATIGTLIIVMIFFNVQYLKKHKAGLKKEIQRNIVTFNGNFYFFIIFSLLSLMSPLLKSVALTQPSGWIKSLIIFFKFINVFFVGFLRPVIILYLLKKKMPNFFKDHDESLNSGTTFFISGHSIQPRQQIFRPYKPFSQNARWGWQKQKFMTSTENACDLNVMHEGFHIPMNSMPDIDI